MKQDPHTELKGSEWKKASSGKKDDSTVDSEEESGENDQKGNGRKKLPGFADRTTLRLVESYLDKEFGAATLRRNKGTVGSKAHGSCDEDGIASFMARVHRQAEIQTEFLEQTNFLLHHQIDVVSSEDAQSRAGSGSHPNDKRSRILDDFIELEEEQALVRDIFHSMTHSIEHSNSGTKDETDTANRRGVLDKRTVTWLRKASGLRSGSDVSSANHHHPAIKSIVESEGRRLTRGMARQHIDKQQQASSKLEKTNASKGSTDGLEALVWALDDLEADSRRDKEASSRNSTTRKRQIATPTARVLRQRTGTSFVPVGDLSLQPHLQSSTRSSVSARPSSRHSKVGNLGKTIGRKTSRLKDNQSSLEKVTAKSTTALFRFTSQAAGRLPNTHSPSRRTRLRHSSSLETSTAKATTGAKSKAKRKVKSAFPATRRPLRQTYTRLTNGRSS